MLQELTTRRSFYSLVINTLGAVTSAIVALPAAAYLLKKPRQDNATGMIEIADISRLKTGMPQEVVFTRKRVDGWKQINEKTTAWVVKTGPETVTAYSPQCTHLGCAYHWEESEKSFLCPCHSSQFALDGKVLAGPAPRPLDRFVSQIENGRLLIGDEIQKG